MPCPLLRLQGLLRSRTRPAEKSAMKHKMEGGGVKWGEGGGRRGEGFREFRGV